MTIRQTKRRWRRRMPWLSWRAVLVRSAHGFVADNCTDWAAALTYYGILALFPGAIVVVAMVSLVADEPEAVNTIVRTAHQVLPDSVIGAVQVPLQEVLAKRGSARVLLSVGALGAIWSTAGYIGVLTRASNAIYRVREQRPWYVLRPLQVGLTVVALLAVVVIALGLMASGPVARAAGELLHIGSGPLRVWQIGRWPLFVLLTVVLLSMLLWITPNIPRLRLRWLTVGGAIALIAWLAVSLGFGLYVANFASYDVTYGSLGAAVVFLVWLFLSNCALMFGIEVNAEIARAGRAKPVTRIDDGAAARPNHSSADGCAER